MKALVTGAAGFAGSWLCRALVDHGLDVEGWIRGPVLRRAPKVAYKTVDLTHPERTRSAMHQCRPDLVFHLAAMTHVGECENHPNRAHKVNCQATMELFQLMPPQCTGVYASTCHVYGQPTYLPIDEDHPVRPDSIYAATKAEAESLLMKIDRRVVVARSFHHTGPGQKPIFALSDWAAQIRNGCDTLRVGNLQVSRDYTDVRDVVNAYILLAQKGQAGEKYNICTGVERTLHSISQLLIGNRPIETSTGTARLRKNDVPRMVGDPTKIMDLGWRPMISLEETLADMTG